MKPRAKEARTIKLSQVLEGSEITKPILEALESVYNPLINEIVEKYDDQLRKNGQYLTAEERRRLKGQLKEDMIIKLHLSINLTKKKMETWEIYPNSEKQTELKFDEEEGESDQAAEQLKQAVLFEVEGINQGEGEDQEENLPGDPGEEGQVPEAQILESILEKADNSEEEVLISDYEKRKAAFELQEAASSPKKRGRKAAAPLQ